ncbi:alpha/beta hydrolase [Streptomyces caniscabiei]|uniref:alpha/beta hydrolase n=1 Tax=Streptomyces caniscabiei TaxID=2746961 RepID=UPI0029A33091|nr:alpha/beta hydrolase [Streptomyces caniscabiei]MDX2600369.1 alpha/beta hydrolase [Streptomyces caniscabiei]MDX2737051.1 alpha/beta hydrolase [Streptomyces caniscabiei]MDX2781407.1 alpha/beta hydrolase [Streptomyces caniscabiei]
MERRKALGLIAATGAATATSFAAVPAFGDESSRAAGATGHGRATAKGGYTFALDKNVRRTSVRFKNRYGIELAADLYVPKNARGKLRALAVSGPFGAVKEQVSGLYANEFARRGYVALAFDPSFTGESGGRVRDVGSPDINTEDWSAAVDFLGLQKIVDRERIGAQGICGLSGMALTAAAADSRIKAVATAAMYDMSRAMSRGYQDYYTREQRQKVIDHLSRQRWIDAENGTYARLSAEVPFDENGDVAPTDRGLPETLPADADPITTMFFDYYRTKRGYHPRSINSTTAWTGTTPMSFFAFQQMTTIDMLAPRKALLVTGSDAHSRYYSEDTQKTAPDTIDLLVVPGADHVDLYDRKDIIPFGKLDEFFTKNLT